MRVPTSHRAIALATLLGLTPALAGCGGDSDRPTAGSVDLPERKIDLPKAAKDFKSSRKRAR